MPADRIILTFGIFTLLASVYVLTVVPEFLVRFCLWLLTHTIYRIRIDGQNNVPSRGPALLVCNHLSHVDGALVGACIQRFVRFLVYKPYYEHWAVNPLLRMLHAIPVGGGREAVTAIQAARRELRMDTLSASSPRGRSAAPATSAPSSAASRRSGRPRRPDRPRLLDRLWGSVFSFKGGRFLWKWPARLPYSVTVSFGAVAATTPAAKYASHDGGGARATAVRRRRPDVLGRQFIASAKRVGARCAWRIPRRRRSPMDARSSGDPSVAVDPTVTPDHRPASVCCCPRPWEERSPTSRRPSPAGTSSI